MMSTTTSIMALTVAGQVRRQLTTTATVAVSSSVGRRGSGIGSADWNQIRRRSTWAERVGVASAGDAEAREDVRHGAEVAGSTAMMKESTGSSGCPMAHLRQARKMTTGVSSTAADGGVKCQTKSMNELDGPIGWPIVGNFLTYLKKENQGKMHEVQARLHKTYGKMFREKWGPQWQVHVSDPRLIEEVFRHEGRHPNRPALQPWILFREVAGLPTGLFTSQGHTWYKYRTEFGKPMLSSMAITSTIGPVGDITDDLISALRRVRDTDGDVGLAKSLPREMHRWSLEAAGSFLFETRLGCLQPDVPERTRKFIAALREMLESSLYLIVGERVHQRLNTSFWRRHYAAWSELLAIAEELVKERENELTSDETYDVDGGSTSKRPGALLSYMLANKNVSRKEIYINLMEMLIAGTDTTANSFCFIAYLLASNPEAQERLYNETCEVMNGRHHITAADLDRMPYVKCVVKEGLRLFPSATMNCRILSEDIVLDGHLIPKNTLFVLNHYASARDNDVFPEADRFMPERWLRKGQYQHGLAAAVESIQPPQQQQQSSGGSVAFTSEDDGLPTLPAYTDGKLHGHHAFGCLPFGYGNRSCLGRRAAMLELTVALSKVVQNFKIEVLPGVELNPMLQTLLTPGSQVPIRFVERDAASPANVRHSSASDAAAAAAETTADTALPPKSFRVAQ